MMSPAILLLALAAAPAPPARTVDQILADSVAAMGGEASMKKHRSLRLRMSVTVQGMGLQGTAEQVMKAPNRSLVTMTIPNVGTLRQGSDGKRLWSEDPINGLRLLEGAEAERARIESTFNAELSVRAFWKDIKVIAAEQPGQECLSLGGGQASPLIRCFDATTHLMVSERGEEITPQGPNRFVRTYKSWTEKDGVKLPQEVEMTTGPMLIQMRTTLVELDPKLDDKLFALPKAPAADAKAKKPRPAAAP